LMPMTLMTVVPRSSGHMLLSTSPLDCQLENKAVASSPQGIWLSSTGWSRATQAKLHAQLSQAFHEIRRRPGHNDGARKSCNGDGATRVIFTHSCGHRPISRSSPLLALIVPLSPPFPPSRRHRRRHPCHLPPLPPRPLVPRPPSGERLGRHPILWT